MRASRRWSAAPFAALAALALAGCSALFGFNQLDDRDAGFADAGDAGSRVDAGDAGAIDAGACDADLSRDPDHCGACGVVCAEDQICADGGCHGLVDVVGGSEHACMLTDDAVVRCWGMNRGRRLGEAGPDRTVATDIGLIATLGPAVELAAGDAHTCARTDAGEVLCWGRNSFGQLGNGAFDTSSDPVQVLALGSSASDLACGSDHCCAVVEGGTRVRCWGRNLLGGVGDGSSGTNRATPVLVQASGGVDFTGEMLTVYAGGAQSCALDGVSGALHCWGSNRNGQLTLPTGAVIYEAATEVTLPAGEIVDLTIGRDHACAIVESAPNRELYCWGRGVDGQLGTGDLVGTEVPQRVRQFGAFSDVRDVARVFARGAHTCVVRAPSAGPPSTWCWGENHDGEAGAPAFGVVATPTELMGGAVDRLGGGRHATCGVRDRRMVCWGSDESGALGQGARLMSATPQPVAGVDDATRVVAATQHTCVVRGSDDRLECFGAGSFYRRGDGTLGDRATPTGTGLMGVTHLDSETDHTCAIGFDGAGTFGVYCFGSAGGGQTGQGSVGSTQTPALVPLDSAATSIEGVVTGTGHSCAFVRTPVEGLGYQCWGLNTFAQHGVGNASASLSGPRSTRSLPGAGALAYAGAGSSYTIVVRDDEMIRWGQRDGGRLASDEIGVTALPRALALAGITALDVGPLASCAEVGTELVCWGANESGQLGSGADPLIAPTTGPAPFDVAGIAVGWSHACVWEEGGDGAVHCRGADAFGQLGDGAAGDPTPSFVRAGELTSVVSVSAGEEHTCAVVSDGQLYCWGHDQYGRLGSGRPIAVPTPVPLAYVAP